MYMCLPIKSLISISNSLQRNPTNSYRTNPHNIHPHRSKYNQTIWPRYSLNALDRFQISIGNKANLSALQSDLSARSSICLFPTPYPTSIRIFIKSQARPSQTRRGWDLHKQLIEYGGAAKVWMTVQVEYEPVNPLGNKEPFEQYLSAAPTRIFQRYEQFSAFENPNIDSIRVLTDRIRKFNAKFIRDKSGLRLARVMQFTLKMVKYAPFERRGLQPLPEFRLKKKAIINI